MSDAARLVDQIVGADDLAELLGVGRASIFKHVRESGAPKLGPGKYPLGAYVGWYLERIREKATEKSGEREKLIRAQRIKHEIEIDVRRGNLVELDTYRADLLELATAFSKLDNQAPRIAAALNLSAPDARRLSDELRDFRLAVSRTILARAGALGSGDDLRAAEKPKRRRMGRRKPRATRKRARAGAVAD